MSQPNQADAELDEIFQTLVYEQLPIKATEIGWEKVGEDVEEAKQKLRAWGLRERLQELEQLRNIFSSKGGGVPTHLRSRIAALQAQLETEEKTNVNKEAGDD